MLCFGTEEIRKVFSDEEYVRCLMDAETAPARAQSDLGVIPLEAGKIIIAHSDVAKIE
jgi:3-carboxy-cis,cis-muconate cycloisomerase